MRPYGPARATLRHTQLKHPSDPSHDTEGARSENPTCAEPDSNRPLSLPTPYQQELLMQRTHTPSSQHLVRDAHSRPSRNAPSARAVTHAQPSSSCPGQVPAIRHALGARRLPAPTRVRAWWSPHNRVRAPPSVEPSPSSARARRGGSLFRCGNLLGGRRLLILLILVVLIVLIVVDG